MKLLIFLLLFCCASQVNIQIKGQMADVEYREVNGWAYVIIKIPGGSFEFIKPIKFNPGKVYYNSYETWDNEKFRAMYIISDELVTNI